MAVACRDPKAEGAVDMHPGLRRMRDRTSPRERVEDARVQIARLQPDDDGVFARRAQRRLELADLDAAGIVGAHIVDRLGADAEQARGAQDRFVPVLCRQDAQARRSGEAPLFDIPAAIGKQLVARRRERGGVRHLATRDEGERRRSRNAEELLYPFAAHLLDDGFRGRGEVRGCVLIPDGSEPIRRDRDRKRAADDPAEEARVDGSQNSALDIAHELIDDRLGRHAVFGKRLRETRAQLLRRCGRADRAILHRFQEFRRMRGGAVEDVGHGFRRVCGFRGNEALAPFIAQCFGRARIVAASRNSS